MAESMNCVECAGTGEANEFQQKCTNCRGTGVAILYAGLEVRCPLCQHTVAVVMEGRWGPYVLGIHEVRHYILDGVYFESTCLAGGNMLVVEPITEH